MDGRSAPRGSEFLSNSSENVITGTVSDVTLTNVDNTIAGAGHLGDGVMVLVNEGSIIATGTNSLEDRYRCEHRRQFRNP
jgi:hypothetical protein